MTVSRRNILKQGALCALFAGVPLSVVRAAAGSQKGNVTNGVPPSPDNSTANGFDRLYSFTTLTFSPHLNTPFRIKSAAGKSVTTELVQVHDRRPASGDGAAAMNGAQCFSLLFRGSNTKLLASNQYAISHDALGTFTMFISPVVNKDKTATYYEAVINHRRS